MFSRGHLGILTVAAIVWGAPTPARAIPVPNNCWHMTRLHPARSASIPANLPAFRLWPSVAHGNPQRSIDDYKIELRDGSGALLPITTEAQGFEYYLIKPAVVIPTGSVSVSLLEDCPNSGSPRLTEPVRTGHYYSVTPAVPLPARIGTLDAQVTGYVVYPFDCANIHAKIRLVMMPSKEAEAFRSALVLTLRTDAGNLELSPESLSGSGIFTHETETACRDATDGSVPRTIDIRARLFGSDQTIEPLQATVNIDCTPRRVPNAAGSCDETPAPAGQPADAGAGARGSDPSAPHPDGGPGGCHVGPADVQPPAPLVLLALVAIALQFARRRR